MKTRRKGKGCGRQFEVDYRNRQRHAFCADKSCQRLRRALGQALRRAKQVTKPKIDAPSRLQRDLKPTEADMLAKNPMFIGLLSMMTGSTGSEELKTVYRRLYERGRDTLGISL